MAELEDELTCSVCQEIFIHPTVVSCGHMFCKTCIELWCCRKRQCPLCRSRVISTITIANGDALMDKVVTFMSEESQEGRGAAKRERQTIRCPVPPKRQRRTGNENHSRFAPIPRGGLTNRSSGSLNRHRATGSYVGGHYRHERNPLLFGSSYPSSSSSSSSLYVQPWSPPLMHNRQQFTLRPSQLFNTGHQYVDEYVQPWTGPPAEFQYDQV